MYRLIALDLDGTLLNSRKELSDANRRALQRAAESGVEIVPTTGRFYDGMPEAVRALRFVRYAITVNGAQVYDRKNDAVLYRAEIPYTRAVEVMRYMDALPVIYDCYMDGWGYMSRSMYDAADAYSQNPHTLEMIRKLRRPVDDLKAFVLERRQPVQKLQMFFQDVEPRKETLLHMPQLFADMAVSTSIANNIEINCAAANKGAALLALCRRLEIPIQSVIAFGDGLNDVSMLEAAGVGVAMQNADEAVHRSADRIAASCDEDGVAQMICELLFGERRDTEKDGFEMTKSAERM